MRMKWNKLFDDSFRKAIIWSYKVVKKASSRLLYIIITCFFFESFIPVASTAVIGLLVARLKNNEPASSGGDVPLSLWLGLVVFLIAAELIVNEVRKYCRLRLIDETSVKLQKELYQHTARMDLQFFETSDSLNRLFRASSGKSGAYGPLQSMMNLASGIIQLTSLVGLMVYLLPKEALILIVSGLPLIVIQFAGAVEKYKLDVRKTQARRLSNYFTSLLTGAQNVASTKLLNLSNELINRFETTARSILDEKKAILRNVSIWFGAAIFIYLTALFFIVCHLLLKYDQGTIETSILVTFLLAAFRALKSNAQISASVASGAEAALAVIPLIHFLDEKPAISDEGGHVPQYFHGNIVLENIFFSYGKSDSPIIKNLSLTIPAGQKVAIVGRNGAGKSTLVKLIARLYEVDSGTILVDGNCIKDLSLKWFHDHISLCFQRPMKFEATVYDNIAFGNWQHLKNRKEEIERLAEETDLAGLIQSLPEGFDTHLGKVFGDVTLSMGQWQRLAITRALAKKDAVLILDEPTASLDAEAEESFFQALKSLAGKRTVVFISHKFSTVREADRILVMDEGKLVEDGTHEELVAKKGYYSSMVKYQQREKLH